MKVRRQQAKYMQVAYFWGCSAVGDICFDINSEDNETRTRDRTIESLIRSGCIDETSGSSLKPLLSETNEPFDIALTRLGYVTEDALCHHLSLVTNLNIADAKSPYEPLELGINVNSAYFSQNRVLPAKLGDKYCALTPDPTNSKALQALSFALGQDLEIHIISTTQFDFLEKSLLPESDSGSDSISNAYERAPLATDTDRLRDLASAEPAVRLVTKLITQASDMRASDIHINPNERGCDVRFRIDGILKDGEKITLASALAVISRFKILADLDIAERRRPQDGRMSFPVAGRVIDFRLSTNPTVYGESLAVRLLDKTSTPLDLHSLGFNPRAVSLLKGLITQPNGIILLTGPTGSGKTTTLYTLLSLLAQEKRNILTIEDPVEYKLEGVNQTQVNNAIDLTFANALRSFLRHDPDVIMVGEMRDIETAKIATRAALTGHLVLSTLHTNDAPSAITRLLDLGVDDFLVSSTLLGVIGQRLVRKKCKACSSGNQPENQRASCMVCNGDGFSGRTVIAEALEIDTQVRSVIKQGVSVDEIRQAAVRQGFSSMQTDGAEKTLAGVTSTKEVQHAVGVYA